jgi:hypothetical protein
MLDNIKNLLKSDEINLKFADLTAVGYPKDSFNLSSGLDDAAVKLPGGPDKINFYSTLDQNMPTVMSIYKKEKRRIERIENLEDSIVKNLKKERDKKRNTIIRQSTPATASNSQGGGDGAGTTEPGQAPINRTEADFEADQKVREELQNELKKLTGTQGITVTAPPESSTNKVTPTAPTAPNQAARENSAKEEKAAADAQRAAAEQSAYRAEYLQSGGQQTGGNLKDFVDRLKDKKEEVLNDPEAKIDTNTGLTVKDFVEEYEDDPVLSSKYTAIGSIDRIIFIIGTYFIRTIVLFMIEWGINSHMITTFQQCFKAYVVGYISLFLVWVLIANAAENAYEENVLLSSIFYYINVRAHKASKFRIGVHIFVQIILLPLLFIIKYKASPVDQDSFEQRRAIYNATSNFTFFIWLMTSIIATRF